MFNTRDTSAALAGDAETPSGSTVKHLSVMLGEELADTSSWWSSAHQLDIMGGEMILGKM